jgi:predicted O-methyltransferase YrrM
MEHYYKRIGEDWFSYPGLYEGMVESAEDGAHFVEVGTWKGRSAVFMAVEIINSEKKIQFDCVDTWTAVDTQLPKHMYKNLYQIFLKNIEPVRHVINPVKMLSVKAAYEYEDNSLDFVFIDASHDYKSVLADITAWYPKVKRKGIIAGHDIDRKPVKDAVKNYLEGAEFQEAENCWIHLKP